MDYHLQHQGQILGVFPLEELHRRRMAGELNGTEHVWREGMADWQTLDAVLEQNAAPVAQAKPPPLPASARRRRPKRVGLIVAALVALAILAGIAVVVPIVTRFMQQWTRIFQARLGPGVNAAVGGRPIVWTTNTMTSKDALRRAREFRQRQWVEGYKARGRRDSPCDGESLRMLETWIAQQYGGSTGAETNSVSDWCDRLMADPECDDPMVLTAAGLESIESFEKVKRLERAVTAFSRSAHRGYPRLCATVSLAETEDWGSQKRWALDERAVIIFGESFSDGSFEPEDQPELAEILIKGWGCNFFYRTAPDLTRFVKSLGQPYEWLALMLDGQYHMDLAWRARGGGYADSVTEKGWEGFRTHLAVARRSFTEAWRLHPEWPQAAARMVGVAMGDAGAAEMRLWFDRAVQAQIDHPDAWGSFRWGLRPRWHGSLDELLALGRAAVDTGRFDSDVPRMLFDVVTDVESELELKGGRHIYGRPDIWPHLQRMYEGYIAEPSEATRADGWRSTYSMVAYFAGQYDVARRQLEALKWEPWPFSLHGWGTDVSLMPLEVAARTGPLGAQINGAESSRSRGDLREAARGFQELTGATNADDRTRSFAQHRVAALELELRLRAGEWVDFLPSTENDPGWRVSVGRVRRLPDGALEVEAGLRGHLVYSRAHVGPDFEVRGEFEVVRSSTEDFQAGLVMGLPEPEESDWLAFRMKRNRTENELAAFTRGWSRQQTAQKVSLKDDRNAFQFRLQGGKATASLNGVEVLRDALPGRIVRPLGDEAYVGLGAFNDMNQTIIRYRNVQLRRLR